MRFAAEPDDGVPSAPPFITGEPAVPTFTPRAVRTPVPKVIAACLAFHVEAEAIRASASVPVQPSVRAFDAIEPVTFVSFVTEVILSVYAVFQFVELSVSEVPHAEPVETAIPAAG